MIETPEDYDEANAAAREEEAHFRALGSIPQELADLRAKLEKVREVLEQISTENRAGLTLKQLERTPLIQQNSYILAQMALRKLKED